MKYHFHRLIQQLRTSLCTKRNRRAHARRHDDNRRLRSFSPEVEQLEERTTPSITSAQSLQIYQNSGNDVADQIVVDVEGAAKSILRGNQTVQQALGATFVQGITNQMEVDLTPLLAIDFGASFGGVFDAG